MLNARILKFCLMFTVLLPYWKDSKGKETPCEIFLDQHWKCYQKRLIILMYFTWNIYRDKWFHIENWRSALPKPLKHHVVELHFEKFLKDFDHVCSLWNKQLQQCTWFTLQVQAAAILQSKLMGGSFPWNVNTQFNVTRVLTAFVN